MEFSEQSELIRIVNSKKTDKGPLKRLISTAKRKLSRPTQKHISLEDFEDFSCFAGSQVISENSEEDSIKIETDLEYLQKNNKKRASFLTLQLNNEIGVSSQLAQHLDLKIFVFNRNDSVELAVPCEITVRDTIIKALIAYEKTHVCSLPNNLDEQGYDLYITDENMNPDTDFVLDHSSYIANLGSKCFFLCEKPEFVGSIYNSYCSSLVKMQPTGRTKLIRFYFGSNSTVVKVNCEQKIGEVLGVLGKKFCEEFLDCDVEFRVLVREGGGECALSNELMFKELDHSEFRLYRKVLIY